MRPLAIGLVYELFGTYPRRPEDPPDFEAELEPPATLEVLERAVEALGHVPVRLGSPRALLGRAGKGELPALTAALSIAEGFGSRNREAWGPVLLEMLGVPQLGSDALTLSLSLDKAWAKAIVGEAGVPVAPHAILEAGCEAESAALPGAFPFFVKPRWEGTAKGIGPSSRVEDRRRLAREVRRIVEAYHQPALVESFLEGPEYTVTVIGNDPPRALPVLQRALESCTRIGLHAVEGGSPRAGEADLPGLLDSELEARLHRFARRAYEALRCRDFARADFKLDAKGRPHFLEMNPLPTFARDGTFGILAELEGRSIEELLAEVFAGGLRRLGLAP